MTEKSNAERLADALDEEADTMDMGRNPDPKSTKRKAAIELRRIPELERQRDQLLEALKHGCPPDCKDGMTDSGGTHPWGEPALIPCPTCAAIASVEAEISKESTNG